MQEFLLRHSWWNLHVSQNLKKNQLRNQEVIILKELKLNNQHKVIRFEGVESRSNQVESKSWKCYVESKVRVNIAGNLDRSK